MTLSWSWVGAVTDQSAVVTVASDAASVRLVVSTASDLSSPSYSAAVVPVDRIAKLDVGGLSAATAYHFGIEEAGVVNAMRGTFSTFPADGAPASFEAAFGCCHNNGADARTFDAIRVRNPAIFVNTGDFHYADIATNIEQDFLDAFAMQLTTARPGLMYRSIATGYMPDDHDYGPNNTDRNNPSKVAAVAAYQKAVPHYGLVNVSQGLYQTWRIGRVSFILIDQRHNRTPNDDPDNPDKTVFGETQKQWIKDATLAAVQAGAPLVVWVFPGVWHSLSGDLYDTMSLFTYERREMADWIAANDLAHRIVIVQGDNHQGGITDGSNADYSSAGNAAVPVISATPLRAGWHDRGGPWTQGPFTGETQYGLIRVNDTGGDVVTVDLEMYGVNDTTGVETLLGAETITTEPRAMTFEGVTPYVYTDDEWRGAETQVYDEASGSWRAVESIKVARP